MNPLAIVSLVVGLIGEAWKLASAAIDSSRAQLAEVEAQLTSAIADLKSTRLRVEKEIAERHTDTQAAIDAAKESQDIARVDTLAAAIEVLDPNERAALFARVRAVAAVDAPDGSSER
jgi:hypothetical protein